MVKFQIRSEGCRAVSVGSPIRFFDPILNNALALRASHQEHIIRLSLTTRVQLCVSN